MQFVFGSPLLHRIGYAVGFYWFLQLQIWNRNPHKLKFPVPSKTTLLPTLPGSFQDAL